jgi:hypothetical protein
VIEEFVQLLIGKVDAELLKRIDSEVLEAENVKHTDKFAVVRSRASGAVDLIHEPSEGAAVQCFRLPNIRTYNHGKIEHPEDKGKATCLDHNHRVHTIAWRFSRASEIFSGMVVADPRTTIWRDVTTSAICASGSCSVRAAGIARYLQQLCNVPHGAAVFVGQGY